VDSDLAANYLDVWLSKVEQRRESCKGHGVCDVATVIEHCDVDAHRPHLFPCHDAQGLCLDRTALLESSLNHSQHLDRCGEWAPRLERRCGHGRKLDRVADHALGGAVRAWLNNLHAANQSRPDV
jgi:hypothetical protein